MGPFRPLLRILIIPLLLIHLNPQILLPEHTQLHNILRTARLDTLHIPSNPIHNPLIGIRHGQPIDIPLKRYIPIHVKANLLPLRRQNLYAFDVPNHLVTEFEEFAAELLGVFFGFDLEEFEQLGVDTEDFAIELGELFADEVLVDLGVFWQEVCGLFEGAV